MSEYSNTFSVMERKEHKEKPYRFGKHLREVQVNLFDIAEKYKGEAKIENKTIRMYPIQMIDLWISIELTKDKYQYCEKEINEISRFAKESRLVFFVYGFDSRELYVSLKFFVSEIERQIK